VPQPEDRLGQRAEAGPAGSGGPGARCVFRSPPLPSPGARAPKGPTPPRLDSARVRSRPLIAARLSPRHKTNTKNKTESDTDEQLLLHIPFTQRVKLSGVAFAGPPDGKGAKTIKLFVNRPSVGFTDAGSTPCAAELSLSPGDLSGGGEAGAGKTIALKPARFTGVDVLSIFIEGNQGDEETTVLSRLALFGSAGETFDVAAIKKIEEK